MTSTPVPTTLERAALWRSLWIILFARMVLDTGFRAAYPFLPFIASGLGVSTESAALIIQARNLIGFASPLFGPMSDRYGRRVMMLVGLGVAGVTGIAVWLVTSLWLAVVVMTMMALSVVLFVPAQQAFLGDNVPYAQRGRVMALAEVAWSLSALVGLPLVGFLIQAQGWRAGLVAIGIFALAAFGLMWFTLPRGERTARRAARALGGSYLEALRAPTALAVIATTFLLAATNENVNVIFGAWMNDRFGLDPLALGFVAAAIGGAELSSELVAAGFVDRVGKWRMVLGSTLLGSAAYLALPWLGTSALWGTAGLVAVYFMFELAVVAALPLMSEVAPNVRATLLSLGTASFSLGRAVGSFTGPALYVNLGFTLTSLVSAAGMFLAIVVWFWFVHERASSSAE